MARTQDGHRNPEPREDVVYEIVRIVAEKEGVSPTELQPPLFDVIDPEALERMVRDTQTLIHIQFEYYEWNIEVRPSEISVTGRTNEE